MASISRSFPLSASPSSPTREMAASPLARIHRALSDEKAFKPVSLHPDRLKTINKAAVKQLSKGQADLDAALTDLSARRERGEI